MNLVDQIKQFCIDNYENGYDACVECWDTKDYEEFIAENNVTSVEQFVVEYAPVIEHVEDIRSLAF